MQELALSRANRGVGRIVIRLSNSQQLFHTLDPAPFREKELAGFDIGCLMRQVTKRRWIFSYKILIALSIENLVAVRLGLDDR
jgi:hypothetical protein